MGFFSWKCKGCGEDLKQDEIVRLNGCVGEYDGYGCAGGFDSSETDFSEIVGWHELCFWNATPEARDNEDPSEDAANQGFGLPIGGFMDRGVIETAKRKAKALKKKSLVLVPSLFPLVRFKCGCVGLRPDAYGSAVVFKSCRGETDETIDIMYVEQVEKPEEYEPVGGEEVSEIMRGMISLVQDGHQMRAIKRMVK